MLALILAIALAALETGAFLGAAFATGLITLAGAFAFGLTAAFGATFFAVAILNFLFV
jgi:hypothetical protein